MNEVGEGAGRREQHESGKHHCELQILDRADYTTTYYSTPVFKEHRSGSSFVSYQMQNKNIRYNTVSMGLRSVL